VVVNKMNTVNPMLACGSIANGGWGVAMILLLLAGWAFSGLPAVMSIYLLASRELPARIKKWNLAAWACYVVPSVYLLLGLYGRIPLGKPLFLWIAYMGAIPFVSGGHFIYLLNTCEKYGVLRVKSSRL